MSTVESNVAIMNGLYNNWAINSPSRDTVGWSDPSGILHKLDTNDPAKVHFTTREYAFAPLRYHTFQVSVRRTPETFVPIQFGQVTKYLNNKGILVDIWVLTGPQQSIETAETSWYAMTTEVKRIIRVFSTLFGSNIQAVILKQMAHDEAAMAENPPKMHARLVCAAKLFETVTS